MFSPLEIQLLSHPRAFLPVRRPLSVGHVTFPSLVHVSASGTQVRDPPCWPQSREEGQCSRPVFGSRVLVLVLAGCGRGLSPVPAFRTPLRQAGSLLSSQRNCRSEDLNLENWSRVLASFSVLYKEKPVLPN